MDGSRFLTWESPLGTSLKLLGNTASRAHPDLKNRSLRIAVRQVGEAHSSEEPLWGPAAQQSRSTAGTLPGGAFVPRTVGNIWGHFWVQLGVGVPGN